MIVMVSYVNLEVYGLIRSVNGYVITKIGEYRPCCVSLMVESKGEECCRGLIKA